MTITLLETIDSTNRVALEKIKDGFDHGESWIADEQTAGRGRREHGARRAWFSPAGKNIYMSIALDLKMPPEKVSPITILVGTIVCEQFRALGSNCWLKWPNDIYVDNRKLGGILTEAVTTDNTIDGVAVGIGLNINVEETAFPDTLSTIATSLAAELKTEIDRMSLALNIRRNILTDVVDFRIGGLRPFADRISSCEGLADRTFEAQIDGKWTTVSGAKIQSEGALLLRVDGAERSMVAGEIRLARNS